VVLLPLIQAQESRVNSRGERRLSLTAREFVGVASFRRNQT